MSENKFGIGVLLALVMLLNCKDFKEMQDELKRLKDKGKISQDDYGLILKKLNELRKV